jgi:hypothetical protein
MNLVTFSFRSHEDAMGAYRIHHASCGAFFHLSEQDFIPKARLGSVSFSMQLP